MEQQGTTCLAKGEITQNAGSAPEGVRLRVPNTAGHDTFRHPRVTFTALAHDRWPGSRRPLAR
jgi:hypothetical protein